MHYYSRSSSRVYIQLQMRLCPKGFHFLPLDARVAHFFLAEAAVPRISAKNFAHNPGIYCLGEELHHWIYFDVGGYIVLLIFVRKIIARNELCTVVVSFYMQIFSYIQKQLDLKLFLPFPQLKIKKKCIVEFVRTS